MENAFLCSCSSAHLKPYIAEDLFRELFSVRFRELAMRISVEKMKHLEGKNCAICGKPLLKYNSDFLAYLPLPTGKSVKAKPERYHLFQCPNCEKIAHKRCWYRHGDKKVKTGMFSSAYQLKCPNCEQVLSGKRDKRRSWMKGYQIPDYPDEKLIEIFLSDIKSFQGGSFLDKIGSTIGGVFKAIGAAALNERETSAISRAAEAVGMTISQIGKQIFKVDVTPAQRQGMEELKCQNCGAPLPMPDQFAEAAVCAHCGTAHLLPP